MPSVTESGTETDNGVKEQVNMCNEGRRRGCMGVRKGGGGGGGGGRYNNTFTSTCVSCGHKLAPSSQAYDTLNVEQ